MLDFKDVTLEDKHWIDELLQYSDYRSTEYCFTSLYTWKHVYKTKVCRYKDALLIRSIPEELPYYIFPAGKIDAQTLKEIIDLYTADAKSMGFALVLNTVQNVQKEMLESIYPHRFNADLFRNSFDYIYSAEDLITLRGKKFQSKRNHIARFKELPNWIYEPVTLENLSECRDMNDEWCARYGCGQNISMTQEACAVKCAIDHFEKLNLKGGLLRLNGKVVAFTIGEMLNSDTMIIHIEKAFADIRGAYPAISQEFLSHQMVRPPEEIGFQYVNREDDAGDEGLRSAKMQYHPLFLLEKWTMSEK